jgi:D-hydroxyproline dehydrogenase subunit alpha
MSKNFDIVVVGAGPAGLAAATVAATLGKRVAVLDDNPKAGGQIWRAGIHPDRHPDPAKARAIAAFSASGAELFSGRQVVDAARPGALDAWVESTKTLESVTYQKLILATGARERFLPFPGWTLPGVFGPGGLQALVRSGYNVRGKRIVVAGTGPLLLAVAAHLKQDGATIVTIAEQSPISRLMPFFGSLLTHPKKLQQGLRLRTSLAGTPYRMGCWPVAAEGHQHVSAVRLSNGARIWTEPCDLLACGFHLVPNVELAMLLGCAIGPDGVTVDENQQTSVPHVYCAGEPTGIAGVDAARLQGEVAGRAAAGDLQNAARLHRRRNTQAAFGNAMNRAFALRPEVLALAQPDTIVCRCEDVRYRDLEAHRSELSVWTDAKLQTRCGMGPCQGRVCGPAIEQLFGWKNNSVRPPLYPVPVSAFCIANSTEVESAPSAPACE